MGSQETVSSNLEKLPKIIGLNGGIGSGKDTTAEYLAINFLYHPIGFSDPIYENLYRLNPAIVISHHRAVYLQTLVDEYGWDIVKRKYPVVRGMLRIEGTENGRHVHGNDCWLKVADQRMAQGNKPRYVFRDVRFPEEVDFIKSRGGEIWGISGRLSPEVEHLPKHESESYTIVPDRLIVNDSTLPRLYHRINAVMRWYIEE